jgi:hypothetical protein
MLGKECTTNAEWPQVLGAIEKHPRYLHHIVRVLCRFFGGVISIDMSHITLIL